MIRRPLSALALLLSLSACAAEPPAKPAPARPALAAAQAGPAGVATEATIHASLKALAPNSDFGKIGPIVAAPMPGFREVGLGGRVVYVSDDGKYLLQGVVFDLGTRENLTQASEAGLRKGMLDQVGSDRRIIFAAAQPRHRVTVFTDIDCGYCRRLHEQMAEYNRLGISVEYLFYPRSGIGSESFEKAVSVWCAPDRRAAMTAAKAGRSLPRGNCSNPVTQDYDLGRRVGLDGTPAIYSAGGTQLGGYLEPADMLARLEEIAARPVR